MAVKEKHEHLFVLKIKRIRADNVRYPGSTGDKAFILQACKYGKETAIDMGATALMLARYKELKHVQTAELTTSG